MKFVGNIDEAFGFVKDQFVALEKKLADLSEQYPKIIPMKEYEGEFIGATRLFENKQRCADLFKSGDPETIFQHHKKVYDLALAEIATIEQENLKAIENNRKAHDAISALVKYYGIPETYYETDPKSRAWPKKKIKVDAGWVTDLRKNIPLSNAANAVRSNLKYKFSYLEEAYKEAKAKKADKERELEQEKKEKERKIFLIDMIKKYDMPSDTHSFEDIVDCLLEKNKYLKLAHYLLMNRNDWNDGFEYAKLGLTYFSIENDLDKEIYNDIAPYTEDWDNDGRCFRDTRWGYPALFGLVEKQNKSLLDDYNTAYANIQY